MSPKQATLSMKNTLGNIIIGAGLVVVGLIDALAQPNTLLMGAIVLALTVAALIVLYMELPGRTESDDEASSSHMNLAGWTACNITVVIAIIILVIAYYTGGTISIFAAASMAAGLPLLSMGVIYAVLSRRDSDGLDD